MTGYWFGELGCSRQREKASRQERTWRFLETEENGWRLEREESEGQAMKLELQGKQEYKIFSRSH